MSPAVLERAPDSAAEVSALFDQAITQMFLAESAASSHDPAKLTMSGLGGCVRRGAYLLAGYAPTDLEVQEKRAAHLGTALHQFLLPRLAAIFGGRWTQIERPTTLRTPQGEIEGTLDLDTLLYAPDAYAGHTLADLKTVSGYLFDQVCANNTPLFGHLMQALGYAVALTQDGYPVRWVSIIYLDRESGRTRTLTVELTRQHARSVFDRAAEMYAYASNPELAPREERGPGLSVVCDGCPMLRRCWGPNAAPGRTGAQASIAITSEQMVSAGREYERARAARLEWEKWEAFWLVLTGREGSYTYQGAVVKVKMRAGAKRKDQTRAYELLEQHGIAVPMTQNQPSLLVTVTEAPGAQVPG